MVKCERNCDRDFKAGRLSWSPQQDKKRGGASWKSKTILLPEQQGFTTEDILWAVGIWSVLLTMSPVVVFYMLMVA